MYPFVKRILPVMLCLAVVLMLAPAASFSADDPVFDFKFAHIFPPPAKHSVLCQAFLDDLEARTNGRIKTSQQERIDHWTKVQRD